MGFGCQCFDMSARTYRKHAMPLSDAEMSGLSFSMVAESFRSECAADGEEDHSADAEHASDDDPAASCPAFGVEVVVRLALRRSFSPLSKMPAFASAASMSMAAESVMMSFFMFLVSFL